MADSFRQHEVWCSHYREFDFISLLQSFGSVVDYTLVMHTSAMYVITQSLSPLK